MLPIHLKIELREEYIWQVWLLEGSGISFIAPPSEEASKRIYEFVECYPNGTLPPLAWERIPSFTRKVLEALLKIPCGKTQSYGEIASKIGCPKGSRAVGQACGRNPFPFFIPCHRVVAAHGWGGFAFGLKMKQKLLEFDSI